LTLVAELTNSSNWDLHGFDIGAGQLHSYHGQSKCRVRQGDGYCGAQRLLCQDSRPAFILCDPFWKDSNEVCQVKRLLGARRDGDVLLIWFPEAKRPGWLPAAAATFAIRFKSKANWGRYLKGAALGLLGFERTQLDSVGRACEGLVHVFANQTEETKELDLELRTSI